MTKGIREDGIKTLDDLKQRCVVDKVTGCWHWQGAKHDGSARVWLRGIGPCAMNTALPVLATGAKPARKAIYLPTCGDVACGNWEHRRLGTRGELMQMLRPVMPMATRLKMAAAKRAAGGRYSKAAHIDIMTSTEPLRVLADRWRFAISHVQRIKTGQLWADAEWRTVRETPRPRFEPTGPVPQVVSAAECRPWANLAALARTAL